MFPLGRSMEKLNRLGRQLSEPGGMTGVTSAQLGNFYNYITKKKSMSKQVLVSF